jgi:GrpB-like predicted nucleotidyltransferase (UPF0157 family)/N-acetylglutamate synthase-like GNAT family acetyltransferase
VFCNIKDRLGDPDVLRIMSYSIYEESLERAAQKAQEYRENETQYVYGWIENGSVFGVCGFVVHSDKVEITNISVDINARHRGIGSAMIAAIRKKYIMLMIEVETDDDAVEFYRKCGFISTPALHKHGVRRWKCVLPATETDEERRARIYPIILSEYNPAWLEWYTEEKSNLERLIGVENICRISHIGSTAVPGLTAKPTVDIILEVNETADLDKLTAALSPPEYICLSGTGLTIPTPSPHIRFIKGYLSDGFAEKVYHIHVVYPNDNDTQDKLLFRDYLIDHPEAVAEYAELKRKLFKDYEHNRDGYTEAKGAFIKEIIGKARESI